MKLQRTVALGAACGAVAVWLAAATTSTPPPSAPDRDAAATAVETRGADLAAEITRLRERLRPTATPLQTRDLFRYRREAASTSRDTSASAASIPPPRASDPVAPATPQLALVGLAEDDGPDGPVRTAIISGTGDLFLVKEGDAVTSRYRVARISADVVELTDLNTGTPLRLALK